MALGVLAVTTAAGSGHPPRTPDHGVNATTFPALWSGDADGAVANGSGWRELASATDVAFDDPPPAVGRWNAGEFDELPQTDASRSVAPPDVELVDGRFVRDAYVTAFAVEPSTRVTVSPGEAPLAIAPDGAVLGRVDYRLELPADETTGDRRVDWSVVDHRIAAVRLVVDDRVKATADGGQAVRLPFSGLAGGAHGVELEADIKATVRRVERNRRRRCSTINNSTRCWTWWDRSVSHQDETVIVREAFAVEIEALTIGGRRAVFPNGDLGLVVYKNGPWRGFEHPAGRVRGVWRFYTRRDPAWDRLETHTREGTTSAHSPAHPLRTVAVPLKPGPTAHPAAAVTVMETIGVGTAPPEMPQNIAVDIVTEPYTASFGLAMRIRTDVHELSAITARGLVRGSETTAQPTRFEDVTVHRSRLDLAIVNETAEKGFVRIRLRDAATGAPINTLARDGYLLVDGEQRETGLDGTVVAVVPRHAEGVSVRYVPDRWWTDDPAYTATASAIALGGDRWHVLEILYQLGVSVSLFLLGIFIIDRFSGARLWPPWRRL